jgi:hypothetical protein
MPRPLLVALPRPFRAIPELGDQGSWPNREFVHTRRVDAGATKVPLLVLIGPQLFARHDLLQERFEHCGRERAGRERIRPNAEEPWRCPLVLLEVAPLDALGNEDDRPGVEKEANILENVRLGFSPIADSSLPNRRGYA